MFVPNEILDEIFEQVDRTTLRNARLAGRSIHEAASEALFTKWTFNVGDSLEECTSRIKHVADTRHQAQIRGIVVSARGTLPKIQPESHITFRQSIRRKLKQSMIDDSSKVSAPKMNREYLRIECRQFAVTYFWHLKRLLKAVAPHLERLYIHADCEPDSDDKTRGYLANLSGSFFLKMLTATLMITELPKLSYSRVDLHGVLCQFFPNEKMLYRLNQALAATELQNLELFLNSIQHLVFKVSSIREMLPDPDEVPTPYGKVSEDNYALSLVDIKKVTRVTKKLDRLTFDYSGHDYMGYKLSDAEFMGLPDKRLCNANFSTITLIRDIVCWDRNSQGMANQTLRSITLDNVCVRPETYQNRWKPWGWSDVFHVILSERTLQTVTDLRLSRLSYFFLINSKYPQEMEIPGWPYLRPLVSELEDDFEALRDLRDHVIRRREEAGLEEDEWLTKFCMEEEVLKLATEDEARKCVVM